MKSLLLTLGVSAAAIAVWAQLPETSKSMGAPNSIGMDFVLVPAGQFQMGCVADSQDCAPDEAPAHPVKITKSFYLGKFEVTQGQWQALMGSNPSYFNERQVGVKAKNYPVEQVTWNSIQDFLDKLNAKEPGKKYRLPTEAEWEYAARAGSNARVPAGTLDQVAWSWTNSRGTTHEVGQLQPNAWGLYDMLGNVWEWVDDGYDPKYYKSSPSADPPGPQEAESSRRSVRHPLGGGSVLHPLRQDTRVIRGSSWYTRAGDVRISARKAYQQGYGDYAGGFRVLLETGP